MAVVIIGLLMFVLGLYLGGVFAVWRHKQAVKNLRAQHDETAIVFKQLLRDVLSTTNRKDE
jgi:hypothetical protein